MCIFVCLVVMYIFVLSKSSLLWVVLFSMNLMLTWCCNFIEPTAIGLCVVFKSFEVILYIFIYILHIYIYVLNLYLHISNLIRVFSFASNLIGSKHIAFFERKKMRFLSSPCRWIETLAVLNLKWLAAQGSMIFIRAVLPCCHSEISKIVLTHHVYIKKTPNYWWSMNFFTPFTAISCFCCCHSLFFSTIGFITIKKPHLLGRRCLDLLPSAFNLCTAEKRRFGGAEKSHRGLQKEWRFRSLDGNQGKPRENTQKNMVKMDGMMG